jgi:hypothetical protein
MFHYFDGEKIKTDDLFDFDPKTASGIYSHVFYFLSSLFLGLFGVLLFLWLLISFQLPGIIEASSLRIRVYEILMGALNFPVFPDTKWLLEFSTSQISMASLILAFLLTFFVALGPLLGLLFSFCFSRSGFLVPLFTIVWSLFLFFYNLYLKAPFSDAILFFVAPFFALPGFYFICRFRRPQKHGGLPSVFSLLFFHQISVLVFSMTLMFFVFSFALPQKKGEWLPRFWTPESLITLRDEALYPSRIGRAISRNYYNHLVTSLFYFRPPLAKNWVDKTVFYYGHDEKLLKELKKEYILPAVAKKEEGKEIWDFLKKGIKDPRSGKFLGTDGFELILLDQNGVTADFWKKLEIFYPKLKYKTAVFDGQFYKNPYLAKEFKVFEGLLGHSVSNFKTSLEQFLFSVQKHEDRTAFREWAYSSGRFLLFVLGLPLLLFWAANGFLALLFAWRRGFQGRFLSLLTALSLLFLLWPTFQGFFLEASSNQEKNLWRQERARLTRLHSAIENLLKRGLLLQKKDFRETPTPALYAEMEDFSKRLTESWSPVFFEALNKALESKNALIRMRALVSLDRLCSSFLNLKKVYQIFHVRYTAYREIDQWKTFQNLLLPKILDDVDPMVVYWAIHLASYAEADNKRLWSKIIEKLEHPELNVRDKAVIALFSVPTKENLMALYRHYLSYRDSCDYVRLHTFQALLKHRLQ